MRIAAHTIIVVLVGGVLLVTLGALVVGVAKGPDDRLEFSSTASFVIVDKLDSYRSKLTNTLVGYQFVFPSSWNMVIVTRGSGYRGAVILTTRTPEEIIELFLTLDLAGKAGVIGFFPTVGSIDVAEVAVHGRGKVSPITLSNGLIARETKFPPLPTSTVYPLGHRIIAVPQKLTIDGLPVDGIELTAVIEDYETATAFSEIVDSFHLRPDLVAGKR